MSDAKLFARTKVQDLKNDLSLDKRDKNNKTKKMAMKKVVANMTMSNNDMVHLFPEVIECMASRDIDTKKMCFLYLLTYAKARPNIAVNAIPVLENDLTDESPLIRALALRTISSIPLNDFYDLAFEYTRNLIHDKDPYVRKTAAYSVSKLWFSDPISVERLGLIEELNSLLSNSNPTVAAAAMSALTDITEHSDSLEINIDRATAYNLALILPDCNEWSQPYILTGLMNFVPHKSSEAVALIDRVLPRLQHANSSIVLGTIRLIIYLINFVPNLDQAIPHLEKRIGPALMILLAKPSEIQYLTLRNCILLLQGRPELLNLDVRVFFCKYNDPIYVKATKLEIVFLLANESNIDAVLREFKECATEIDIQVVKKSVRAIGKLAVKIESAAQACVEAIVYLISTGVSYIVQEATVVIKNIFRKYPNRYESIISSLCDNLDSLDEPEAKASMIWIIGQYADRIENSHVLLGNFMETFADETIEVQLALLTAIVRLFFLRPTKGQDLLPKIIHLATDETDSPDLRDRGYMYWRMISSDPQKAKETIMAEMPRITTNSDRMDDERLEEMELLIGTLATIYLKPLKQVFRSAKPKRLPSSPALAPRRRYSSIVSGSSSSLPGATTSSSSVNRSSQPVPAASNSKMAPPPVSTKQNVSMQSRANNKLFTMHADSSSGLVNLNHSLQELSLYQGNGYSPALSPGANSDGLTSPSTAYFPGGSGTQTRVNRSSTVDSRYSNKLIDTGSDDEDDGAQHHVNSRYAEYASYNGETRDLLS